MKKRIIRSFNTFIIVISVLCMLFMIFKTIAIEIERNKFDETYKQKTEVKRDKKISNMKQVLELNLKRISHFVYTVLINSLSQNNQNKVKFSEEFLELRSKYLSENLTHSNTDFTFCENYQVCAQDEEQYSLSQEKMEKLNLFFNNEEIKFFYRYITVLNENNTKSVDTGILTTTDENKQLKSSVYKLFNLITTYFETIQDNSFDLRFFAYVNFKDETASSFDIDTVIKYVYTIPSLENLPSDLISLSTMFEKKSKLILLKENCFEINIMLNESGKLIRKIYLCF